MRGPADADEPDDTAAFEEAGQVSENMLTRLQHRAQGVPASWKDEIEDEEDQQNLDEAREISAFNRQRESGEFRVLEDELKESIHLLQMNTDPRLEFGMETPVLQELAAPNLDEMLQATREPMRKLCGIESDEDWQDLTAGLDIDFAVLHKDLRYGHCKPHVQEASLEHYVQQAMPSSHPMFPFVSQSLQMLQHNPNWDQQKKSEYMWRLIKDLS